MSSTIDTILTKLRRNRRAPLLAIAGKTSRYLRESASAVFYLRRCDRVGARPRVDGALHVSNEGRIEIGDDVRIISRWAPVELSSQKGGTLTIGSGSSINYGTLISASKQVTIGAKVMIGNYCVIADTQAPGTPADENEVPRAVEIGDGAWLAVRVTVLPGAKIGAGAVITAGSVVDGEIPAGVLAGGVPARVLRQSVVPPANGAGSTAPSPAASSAPAPPLASPLASPPGLPKIAASGAR